MSSYKGLGRFNRSNIYWSNNVVTPRKVGQNRQLSDKTHFENNYKFHPFVELKYFLAFGNSCIRLTLIEPVWCARTYDVIQNGAEKQMNDVQQDKQVPQDFSRRT